MQILNHRLDPYSISKYPPPTTTNKFNYNYLIWLDNDATFNNLDFNLSNLLQHVPGLSSTDLFLACDSIGLNFGVAIFKNSLKTQNLVNLSLKLYYNHLHWQQEQLAFSQAVNFYVRFRNLKVTYLSKKFFNSYNLGMQDWAYANSWIAHTPNCQGNCLYYARKLRNFAENKYARAHNFTEPIDSALLANFLDDKIDFEKVQNNITADADIFRNYYILDSCSGNGM